MINFEMNGEITTKKAITVRFTISFIFYFFAFIAVLFFDSRGLHWSDISLLEYIRYAANVVPFKTITTYVSAIFTGNMNLHIPIRNLIGNVFLFFPMGIYLLYFYQKLRNLKTYASFMAIFIFIIENLQLFTRRGSFDIDDFILNMLGAVIGYAVWKTKFVQTIQRSLLFKKST